MSIALRKHLCAENMITSVYHEFQKIPDPRKLNNQSILFTDILMSGLAIFSLKFPSLLKYDQHRGHIKDNLQTLYHVSHPPSDTYLRERLDELDPAFIRPAFKKIFANIQRGNCLKEFEFLTDYYLLALDGTGYFSSSNVCCEHCCKKNHKDGSVTYYHQMLGGCIVHPDKSNVIPLCPEVIKNGDGTEKNDCELNAAKRFIANFKREHPHLQVIIVADGITSNAPYISLLENNGMKYILSAKQGDHEFLFKSVDESEETKYYEFLDNKGYRHQFRYLNKVALNQSNPDVRVNFLEYMQTDPKGKETVFSWVTNIKITQENVFEIMKGGRAKWKIENETFNTLKNLSYNFEHNYGHGKKYLSTILCLLMLLAFLIDQVQGMTCSLFKAVRKQAGSLRGVWEEIRTLFKFVAIQSWEWLYRTMISGKVIDTS